MDNNYNMQSFYNSLMRKQAMLFKYQFIVEFIQGGTMYVNTGGDNVTQESFSKFFTNAEEPDKRFSYYAQSASIPAFTIQKGKINYFGNDFRVPTVKTFNHDWSCTILLEQDMIIYEKLRSWQQYISDLQRSGGGIKTIPNVDLRINLLNSYHTEFTTSFVLAGVWPTKINQIDLAYKAEDNTALTVKLDLKYQYCYEDTTFSKLDDPLINANHKI